MAVGGNDQNTKKWTSFLDPLRSSNPGKKDMKPHCMGTLSTPNLFNFVANLESQTLVHSKEKEDGLREKKLEIEKLFHSILRQKTSFGDLLSHIKDYIKIDSRKPDVMKSGSNWTLEMLAKYFSLDDDKFYAKQVGRSEKYVYDREPRPGSSPEVRNELQDILILLGVRNAPRLHDSLPFTGLSNLNCCPVNLSEYGVRMILDLLLRNMCRNTIDEEDNSIRIFPEHSLKCHGLPTNTFDYVIMNSRACVGIVEAKTPGTMNKKAVAQLVLQLMSLMSTASEETELCCFFGVLTDGFRFVFAYVDKNGVYFEIERDVKGKVTIRVYEANSWEDLDSIQIKILSLCYSVPQGIQFEEKTLDSSLKALTMSSPKESSLPQTHFSLIKCSSRELKQERYPCKKRLKKNPKNS